MWLINKYNNYNHKLTGGYEDSEAATSAVTPMAGMSTVPISPLLVFSIIMN